MKYVIEVKPEFRPGRARWYKPNSCGYTNMPDRAGLYSREEATAIVQGCSDKLEAVPASDLPGNEATAYPYWMIIDPIQMMRPTLGGVASMVSGPFFSREEAENKLKAQRYNYTKRAAVYCCSGHMSPSWRSAHEEGRVHS